MKPLIRLFLLCLLSAPAWVAAQDSQSGQFQLSATLEELVSGDAASYFASVLDADAPVEWDLYVPETYDPASPAGLMVYVSPGDSGRIPESWKQVMADKNVIWIGANDSGNRVDGGMRIAYAVLAPILASKTYKIDRSRIYVSGLSGGGRVASIVAPEYAQLFKGAIYNCGVNFWGRREPPLLEQVKANRYVFITGSDDFNRRDTRKAFNSYQKAGVTNSLLMDIAHMGHQNPNATDFAAAIDYLDGTE